MSEVSRTFEIINERGMHARAATKLVLLAQKFSSEVDVEKDGVVANAKSVMGLLALLGVKGSRVTVRARGNDAETCVSQIGELIADRFGEGH